MGRNVWRSILHVVVLLSSRRAATCLSTFPIDESQISQNRSESLLFKTQSCREPGLSIRPVSERPLSELLESLTRKNIPTDFHKRLLEEEKEQAGFSLVSQTSSSSKDAVYFLLKVAAAGVILVLAANLLQGVSLIKIWKDLSDTAAVSSLLWFPFLWIRPSHMLGDSLSLAKFFGRSDLIAHTMDNLWSTMRTTFTQIVAAELWGRFWKVTSKKMNIVFGEPLHDSNSKPGQSYVPEWLIGGYSFVASTVEKGCTKLFQKTMQKHLHQSIVSISSFMLLSLRDSIFQPSTNGNGVEKL